jgi:hypothetical protein
MGDEPSSKRQRREPCQLCNKSDHSAPTCPRLSQRGEKRTVNLTQGRIPRKGSATFSLKEVEECDDYDMYDFETKPTNMYHLAKASQIHMKHVDYPNQGNSNCSIPKDQIYAPHLSRIISCMVNSTGPGSHDNAILVDNGAELPIVNSLKLLSDVRHDHRAIILSGVNGKTAERLCTRGTWSIQVLNEGKTGLIKIKNTLYAPNSPKNIVALRDFETIDTTTIRKGDTLKVFDNSTRQAILTASQNKRDGLYYLSEPQQKGIYSARALPYMTLHERLGHPSNERLDKCLAHELLQDVKAIPRRGNNRDQKCVTCKQAKMDRKKATFFEEKEEYKPGELLHGDIIVLPVIGIRGDKYALLLTDDESRYRWIFTMKTRADLHILIRRIVNLVLTQYNTRVKRLRTDNEFVTNAMKELTDQYGIITEPSPPY